MEMVDMKKLETAILYIQRITDGNNPVNNMPVEEDTVLNNPNVIRCMHFVKDILEEVKKNGGYVGKKRKTRKSDFPIEILETFEYREDKTITKFVEQLNEQLDASIYQKITYKVIVDWLKLNDFLKRGYSSEFEKDVTYPTQKGKSIGITASKEKNNRGTEYIRIVYGKDAQQFIVKNMRQILKGKVYEPED